MHKAGYLAGILFAGDDFVPDGAVRGHELFRVRGQRVAFIIKIHFNFTLGVDAPPDAVGGLEPGRGVHRIGVADFGGVAVGIVHGRSF